MSDGKLGVVEARFADIIWEHEPLSMADLVRFSEEQLQWKRTTTYTVLKRLSQRGLFENKNGTVYALISRDEFYARQSERFIAETFAGSLPAFLNAFASQKRLSQEEIAEIRKMIDTYEEG